MPLIIVKSVAGVNFVTENKTIALKGNGLINEVSNDDFASLKKNACFSEMLENGFIIESSTRKEKDETKSDIMKEVTDKQDADIKKSGSKTKRV